MYCFFYQIYINDLLNVFFFLSTGVVGANDVFQPNILWAEMGQSPTINCSHTKGVDYNKMYWFRQHQGESMELIVYTTSFGTLEFGNVSQSKFSAIKTVPESGSLEVKDVDYNDNAVYFCAVRDNCYLWVTFWYRLSLLLIFYSF